LNGSSSRPRLFPAPSSICPAYGLFAGNNIEEG
jgi:hypothetical protein